MASSVSHFSATGSTRRSDPLLTPVETISTKISTLKRIFAARNSTGKRQQVSVDHYSSP
jgi:hypothetical protein